MTWLRTVLQFVTVAALAASGCERAPRPDGAGTTDTTVLPATGDSGSTGTSLDGWNPAAGPVLFVASESAQSAAAVFPHAVGELTDSIVFDERTVSNARVDLF